MSITIHNEDFHKFQPLDLKTFGISRQHFILDPPLGTNSLPSKQLFLQRKHYRDNVYSEIGNTPFDSYYRIDDFFYGRTNENGAAVVLREDKIKQLQSKEGTVFVANFVADAFENFSKHFRLDEKIGTGRTLEGSVFQEMQPLRGYINPNTSHTDYMGKLYSVFVNSYLEKKHLHSKIKDFNDFLVIFLDFCGRLASVFPITRTSFLTSHYCHPRCSGLIIEIGNGQCGNDQLKHGQYLTDDHFFHYRDAAAIFGFKIDKNAPWRLVADISSPNMKKYIERYGKTAEEMFIPANFDDISGKENLLVYLLSFWNSYIFSYPFASSYVMAKEVGVAAPRFLKEMHRRGKLSMDELKALLPLPLLLRLYVYLRAMETKRKWSQAKFEQIVKTAKQYVFYESLDKALGFVELNVREEKKNYVNFLVIENDAQIQALLDDARKVTSFRF